MINPKILDDFSKLVSDRKPVAIDKLQDDLKRNLDSGVSAALNKLDLVTREEFEVQKAVLARSRERLEALEKLVAQMESSQKD